MSDRIQHLKDAWDDREQRLGATKRSVLFKRFPGWLNQSIHRRHRSFVLRHLPEKASRVLDVGCGYGRMSLEIKQRFPEMQSGGGLSPAARLIQISAQIARSAADLRMAVRADQDLGNFHVCLWVYSVGHTGVQRPGPRASDETSPSAREQR